MIIPSKTGTIRIFRKGASFLAITRTTRSGQVIELRLDREDSLAVAAALIETWQTLEQQ